MNKLKAILLLLLMIICLIGLINSKEKKSTLNTDEISGTSQTQIALYFANPSTGELSKEYRYVDLKDVKEDMAGTIISELLKGPNNSELESKIPKGTKVNSVKEEGQKILVDFTKQFLDDSEDEMASLHKIYSVVNSLTEIMEINEVEISVDGVFYTNKTRL